VKGGDGSIGGLRRGNDVVPNYHILYYHTYTILVNTNFKWVRGKELGEKEVEGQKFKVER